MPAATMFDQLRGVGVAGMLVAAVSCPAVAQESEFVSVASAAPESADLAASVASGVVQVIASAYGTTRETGLLNLQRRVGAGAIVDDNGHVLTSASLLAEAMQVEVVVTARGGSGSAVERVVPADLVGIVAELDLAVLRVPVAGLQALRLSQARLTPGDRVLTVAPGGPGGAALAEGVVLATGAQVREDAPVPYVVTSAPRSVAGAPLVNEAGEIVGLASAFMDDASTKATATVALPAALLGAALVQATAPTVWERGVVGLTAQRMVPVDAAGNVHMPGAQLVVAAVAPGMPAERAGVRAGDRIVSVNDQPVNGMELATLYLALYTLRAGQALHLGVQRDGRLFDLRPTAVSARDIVASQ